MGGIIMNVEDLLNEALRQWNDFKEDRKDCTFEDYNNFILEIFEEKKNEVIWN